MPNETIRPPDMVGAGAYPQPQDPASLIGLLRSQGSLPAEAMSMMAPPPQASPLASSILGGVAMMPGQTGAQQAVGLNQQQAQFQQQQQMWQAEMMQRIRERKQAQMERAQQSYLDMSDTLMKSDDETTRTYGAKMRMDVARKMGVQLPESVVQGMATRRIKATDANDILVKMGMGYTDEQLARMYPDLKSADLQGYRQLTQDPKALRAAGFDPDQLRKGQLDLKIKEGQAAEAGHPELKGDGRTIQAATVIHQKMFGTSYLEGDSSSQSKALELARQQVQAEDERKLRLQSQLSLDKAMELALLKSSIAGKKPLTPIQKQKLLEPMTKARNVLSSVDAVEKAAKDMNDLGALPKGDDWASMLSARLYRTTVLRGNKAVQTFEQLWSPVSIGQIDRGMFDEKGLRAMQAFQKQAGLLDNMPPYEAIKAYLDVIRQQLTRKMRDDVADWEDLGYPDDVLNVARRTLGTIPGQPTPLPKSPLTPPADLTYDPKTKKWGKP